MKTLASSRFKFILFGIALMLCIPLIAMQFTSEVNWNAMDFLVAFILLFSLGLSIEFILQKKREVQNKRVWILIAVIVFLLIWGELAVGIFGTPFSGS